MDVVPSVVHEALIANAVLGGTWPAAAGPHLAVGRAVNP